MKKRAFEKIVWILVKLNILNGNEFTHSTQIAILL